MQRLVPVAAGGLLIVLVLLVSVCGRGARAADRLPVVRFVTNLNDSGPGSLRQTIAETEPDDGIEFDDGLSGTITVTNGEMVIPHNLAIFGPGARRLTLDAGFRSRHFRVAPGAVVSLSGLTLRLGKVQGAKGADAGSDAGGGDGGSVAGGAILNEGTLTLTNCDLTNNFARGGDGGSSTGGVPFRGGKGGDASGGGIYNTGALTLRSCSLRGNQAITGTGGPNLVYIGGDAGTAAGGAIASAGSSLTIIDSTLNQNAVSGTEGGRSGSSPGGQGAHVYGGCIASENQGATVLVNCTLVLNLALAGDGGNTNGGTGGSGGSVEGGGLWDRSGSGSAVLNTLIAFNQLGAGDPGGGPNGAGRPGFAQGPDVYSFVRSRGHNLVRITDGSFGWLSTDRTGTASQPLDPLLVFDPVNNDGPTPTFGLKAGSPAIDAGDDTVLGLPFSLATDQRGYPRRIGAHVDIGAFELDPPQPGPGFVVTNLLDHDDGVLGIADCTLREAIRAANAASSRRTITFRPGLAGTLVLQSGELPVTNGFTITGPGARLLSVSGGAVGRVLNIVSGAVSISGLTILNGRVTASGGASAQGGGILNAGTLTLTDCTVTGNSAIGGRGATPGARGSTAEGGGIHNQGVLNLNGCTLSSNRAVGGSGGGTSRVAGGTGGDAIGGALSSAGSLSAVNCTFDDNSAAGGRGGTGSPSGLAGAAGGGALFSSGTLAMRNVTLAGNRAVRADTFSGAAVGGGLCLTAAGLLSNTLVAGNTAATGPDASGEIRSQGHNLVGNPAGSSGWVATDRTGTPEQPLDPRLGELRNNGGPTNTRALLSTSPALNLGNDAAAPPLDQRGFTRSGASDIGAFEFGGQPRSAPVDVSISPSSGASGALAPRLFTAKYSDAEGGASLAAAYLLINAGTSQAGALYGWYDAVNNKLFLRNNANNAWLGGFAPGSANTISDPGGRGSLNCAGTTVAVAGNVLTVTWSFTPIAAFSGTKDLYLFARDRTGLTDGFDRLGTWTVTTGPSNLSVSPASGSSATGTFRTLTCTYSDPNGSGNIVDARLLVNSSVSGAGALYAYYDALHNLLFLRNNANTAWLGGFAPGSANVIRDPQGQGSLNCAATRVTRGVNTLAITWGLTPAGTFTGTKNLYLFVKDAGGLSDGLEALGTWTIQ